MVLAGLALSAVVILWRRGPGVVGLVRQPLVPGADWRSLLAWLDPPLLALLAVTALVFGVRLWVVRGINVGFWGDSYQHTLITQLVLDNGGLFQSWEPYAPLQTFTYHFGLHGDVALFQWATGWLTGNPTPRTVVLVGQFLNGLAALALYPLTVRLCGGNRWAGVLAVLVAGLLTPMPMFYVNWGRYTQLAGQVILPVALWLTLEAVEADRWDPRRLGLAVLAVAGLALTHYFVLAFYVMFWPFYLIVWSLSHRARPRLALTAWLRLAVIGLGAVLLVVPWAVLVLEGLLPRILGGYLQGTPSEEFLREETRFYPLTQFCALLHRYSGSIGRAVGPNSPAAGCPCVPLDRQPAAAGQPLLARAARPGRGQQLYRRAGPLYPGGHTLRLPGCDGGGGCWPAANRPARRPSPLG